MKMKWIWMPVPVLLIGCVAFVGWYRWDSAKNRGYTFGYFGEFNTVRNALAAIPGVTVLDSGGNEDIVFEELRFDIRTSNGRQLRLWFGEQDPIRKMSGEKLARALVERIEIVGRSGPFVSSP